LRAITRKRFVVILRFVALYGEARVGTIVVAGDVVVFESEQIERQAEAHVLGAAHPQPSGTKPLCFDEIRGLFDTGRYVGPNVGNGDPVYAGDEAKLANVYAERRILICCWKRAPVK